MGWLDTCLIVLCAWCLVAVCAATVWWACAAGLRDQAGADLPREHPAPLYVPEEWTR